MSAPSSSNYKKYWDEERETLAPKQRDAIILDRIQSQLEYVYHRIPFYRRLYDEHGVRPSDVRSLDDFTTKIPIINKKMLLADQREHPPFGSYLGVSIEDVLRINGSAGTTTGVPTFYGVSKRDWDRISDAEALCQWAAGVRPSDIVHITYPFSLWLGGWGVLSGLDRIGSANFPLGFTESQRHIQLMYHLKATVMWATPSYAVHLAEVAREMGYDPAASSLRMGLVAGEPGGRISATRELLAKTWNICVHDSGSTSEMCPFQTNIECDAHSGTHCFTDEVYTEVVAKDDANAPVPMGTRGAVVYTHLYRESQPMIRMWAGDETYMIDEPCPCGRTYPRLPDGVLGRIDDMLIIRGANVYPSAIEDTLRRIEGVGLEFRIVVEKRGALDEARVQVEYSAEMFGAVAPQSALAGLSERIETNLKASLGVRFGVEILKPGTLERTTLKAKRVTDKRKTVSAQT